MYGFLTFPKTDQNNEGKDKNSEEAVKEGDLPFGRSRPVVIHRAIVRRGVSLSNPRAKGYSNANTSLDR
jgi:hypothetical protein